MLTLSSGRETYKISNCKIWLVVPQLLKVAHLYGYPATPERIGWANLKVDYTMLLS
jgi:hypothetical protein